MARSSSPSDPKSKAVTLLRAAEALAAAPSDVSALARVAAALDDMGNRSLAARAFEALSASAREDGQFALALFAAASLERLGDVKGARTHKGELARAYAKDSKRVDPARRVKPPAPPRKPKKDDDAAPARSAKDAKGAAGNDPQAAMKAASEAVVKAAAHAAELAKKAGPLPAIALAAALDTPTLEQLCGLAKALHKKPADVVVDVGDDASALFLVARGALAVSRDGEELARLGGGAFFGEIALLGGTRRTARVEVVDDAWLLEIPRDALESAAAKAPALADTLARYARARLLANTMRTCEVFNRLEADEREQLIHRFEPSVLKNGQKAITAGEEGQRLHVVVSGELDVKKDGKQLGSLGPGDVFGEMSLLGRRPATADVVAHGRTVTLSLPREKFDDIAMKHPEVIAEVYKLVVAREAKNRASGDGEHHEVSADDIVV